MIFVRISGIVVSSEALVGGIVGIISCFPFPVSAAFDSKVIVEVFGQRALSGSTFEYSLSKCDTGGNVIFMHLFDSHIPVLLEIIGELSALRMSSVADT